MVSGAQPSKWLFTPLHGHHDVSVPRLDIALQVEDLLPGTQNEFAIRNRYRKRWPHQRGLQVGMPVTVGPCLFVAVFTAGRNQAVQKCGQVINEARLELDRADDRRAADVEDVRGSGLHAGLHYDRRDLGRNVVDVTLPFRVRLDCLLIHHRDLLSGP